ncbi:hypothetical protein TNIN_227351 [Trichonephila inaurata madagascariensis]|uniref:Uncharacterized protein n=1 Tax=Trichonephila inaurata madagascariensis TaxID=2747483 RepID=A0A8X7CED2_9ARAC|nr:hypothetical protein TNIN_227351 [Trichonephila inaurata madagascariensis]
MSGAASINHTYTARWDRAQTNCPVEAATSLSLRCRNKYPGTITSPTLPPSLLTTIFTLRPGCSCASPVAWQRGLQETQVDTERDNGHIYRNNILQRREFMEHGRSDIYQGRLKHIGPPPAVIELYRPCTK